jgi:cyclase
MTLAKRIIPTMLVRGRTLVKGRQFAGDRSIGHVLQAARVHAARGVDELCILDIGATAEGRGPDLDMVRELTEGCFVPVTVGGGVKSPQDIDALLRAGADKCAIGSASRIPDLTLLQDAAERFGRQAIVVSLDIPGDWPADAAAATAAHLERNGAGEILLQSIDRDGMMCGYDLDLIRAVSSAVSIPVIASGGCSSYMDMHEAFIAGADACAVGALVAFGDETPRGAARWLKQRKWEVRT